MLNAAWQWWTGTSPSSSSSSSSRANDDDEDDHDHDNNDNDNDPYSDLSAFSPRLPIELRDFILQLTLEPPTYAFADQRSNRLQAYHSFDKSCYEWSTLEHFYKHVMLSNWTRAIHFINKIKQKDLNFRNLVETVRLGQFAYVEQPFHSTNKDLNKTIRVRSTLAQHGWWGRPNQQTTDTHPPVASILEWCPNVKELWIAGLSTLNLNELNLGQNLTSLYILETRISPGIILKPNNNEDDNNLNHDVFSNLCLPNLQLLHVSKTIFSQDALYHLLNPLTLPKLDTLHYLSVHQSLAGTVTRPQQQNQSHQVPDTVESLNLLTRAMSNQSITSSSSSSSSSFGISSMLPQLKHITLGHWSCKTLSIENLKQTEKLESFDLPFNWISNLILQSKQLNWSGEGLRAIRLRDDELRGFEQHHHHHVDDSFRMNRSTRLTKLQIDFALKEIIDWLDHQDRIQDFIITVPRCIEEDTTQDSNEIQSIDTTTTIHEKIKIVEEILSWSNLNSTRMNGKLILWKTGPWDQKDSNDAGFNISTEAWRRCVQHRLGLTS
ncbi:hypothetical protein OIO90_005532 [Microbotryomycetes sp. JL221]|nr:hypothetical protein OIO90_005532 [Microbotryomycetes sp. JL221]